MAQDKYTAVWVSHSSISDFLACPKLYFLKNIHKDPKTGHKIKVMSPPLALGQAVHEVLENLSVLPKESRFNESLVQTFQSVWKKVSGRRGGFFDEETEHRYRARGEDMIRKVEKDPGPLTGLAVKIQKDLPWYWLSDEENIILCGKIDWLEYLPETDSVHIIDFKTGRSKEDESSLQLPIYHLLVHNCQQRNVTKASYWYLSSGDGEGLVEKPLPDLETAHNQVLDVARKMKLARQLERFPCTQETGCYACSPYQCIVDGEGELVGVDDFGSDVYVLAAVDTDEKSSVLL